VTRWRRRRASTVAGGDRPSDVRARQIALLRGLPEADQRAILTSPEMIQDNMADRLQKVLLASRITDATKDT